MSVENPDLSNSDDEFDHMEQTMPPAQPRASQERHRQEKEVSPTPPWIESNISAVHSAFRAEQANRAAAEEEARRRADSQR